MKGKKFLFILFFIFSLLISLLPIFFGAYYEIDKIFRFLKYQEVSKDKELEKWRNIDFSKFKTEFMEKTNGIVGRCEIPDFEMDFLVFSNRGMNRNFFGDINFSNCVFIKAEKNFFSENFSTIFDCLEEKDDIFLNFFGERKKYSVEKIRNISYFNEEVYCKNNPNSLNILVEMPCGGVYGQLLIKAVEISKEEEDFSFFSLYLKSRYLVILSFFAVAFFILIFILCLRKFFVFLQQSGSITKKKYIRNMCKLKYIKNMCKFKYTVD